MLNIFKNTNEKITTSKLLSIQKDNAKQRSSEWKRIVKQQLSQNEQNSITITQKIFNQESIYQTLKSELNKQPTTNHNDVLFDELSKSLYMDIKGYIHEDLHKKLAKVEIGFIPTGVFDAYCLNQDTNNQIIDGYVICLSQGLYFSLQLLFKSLVLENVQGELLQYRQSGHVSYQYAIKLFFDPSFKFDKEVFFNGLSAEVQGELTAYQHNLSTIILKFIVLHEFAHITHNDLTVLKSNKLQYLTNEELNLEVNSNQHWQAELKADKFALNCICPKSMSPVGAWANFSQIYLFLYFISDIEQIKNNGLSITHPPAKYRAKQLLKLMNETFPQSEDAKKNMDWVENATQRWRE